MTTLMELIEGLSIPDFSRVEAVLQEVGRSSRKIGGFCPEYFAPIIASKLNLRKSAVLEILNTPNITPCLDTLCMIPTLIQNGSIPVGWTQGELIKPDPQTELYEGYQAIKFERAGVLDMLTMQPLSERFGLDYLMGGYEKCTEELLNRVAIASRESGLPIAITDDLLINLQRAGAMFLNLGKKPKLYLIDREYSQHNREVNNGNIQVIHTLLELPQYPMIHLLDGDRTLLDTNGSKEDMQNRLAAGY